MREPSLSQGRSAEPEPSGAEPGLRAEYALLDVLLTLGHLDPAEREAAIELLTELGREAIPALVRASTEARRDSRLAAAHAMGILGYDEFLPELHRLAHDPDSWTHTVAAQAYTRIALTQDDPRAVLQLFAGGLPPAAADAVADLLVAHGYPLERVLANPTPGLIPLLVRLIRLDGPRIYQALAALGPEAIPPLLAETRAVISNTRLSVSFLFNLLGELGAATDDPQMRERIADALLDVSLAMSWTFVQSHTLSAMRRMRDVNTVRHMLDRLHFSFYGAESRLAAGLIVMLAGLGDEADLPRLEQWYLPDYPIIAGAVANARDRLAADEG